MPRYDASDPAARQVTARIACLKLDGEPLFRRDAPDSENQFVKACDTDEGWVDIFETEMDSDGKRRLKMSPWVPSEDKPGATKCSFIVKRLIGKVEVSFE